MPSISAWILLGFMTSLVDINETSFSVTLKSHYMIFSWHHFDVFPWRYKPLRSISWRHLDGILFSSDCHHFYDVFIWRRSSLSLIIMSSACEKYYSVSEAFSLKLTPSRYPPVKESQASIEPMLIYCRWLSCIEAFQRWSLLANYHSTQLYQPQIAPTKHQLPRAENWADIHLPTGK